MKNIILKPKQFIAVSVISLFSAVLTNVAVGILSAPTSIQMIAGDLTNNEINAGFPLAAEISGGHIYDEIASVSGTNDEPVGENISVTFSLNGKQTESRDVYAVSSGNAGLEMSLSLMGIPVKTVAVSVLPDTEVIPCGKTVGVRINTAGVMVLGTGAVETDDGKSTRPSDGKLRSGDLVVEVKINGKTETIEDKRQLQKIIENSGGNEMTFTIKRDNASKSVKITPVKSASGKYTVGAWIRDGTQGIGTVTYFNPTTKMFGALGHGILDVDTKKLMTVKKGQIMDAEILSVKKGKKGSPGELEGDIKDEIIIGTINANTSLGLYGSMNVLPNELSSDRFKIAFRSEIHEGPAIIRSNISGRQVRDYNVYIESVSRFGADDSKGMVVRITDEELLTKTNGIVQGMSGSPIIQDGKIIGAVTHVFVQNPTKGYGVFIENMIRQETKLK